jgi:hypothetical protein
MTPHSESEFDRELKALLDVEPAADFTMRVRKAIEGDAAKPAFLQNPFFGVAIAAGALLVAGTAVYLRQPVGDPNPAASHVSAVAQVRPTSPTVPPSVLPEIVEPDIVTAPPRAGAPVNSVRARRILSDEVMVPAEQLATYERFIRRAASHPLVASFEEGPDLSAALSIPPLVIEPVEAFSEMEGVLQ